VGRPAWPPSPPPGSRVVAGPPAVMVEDGRPPLPGWGAAAPERPAVVRRPGGGPAGASARALWAPTRRPGRAGPAPRWRGRGPGRGERAPRWRRPAGPLGRRRPWPPGRAPGPLPCRRPPRRRPRRREGRQGRPPSHRARTPRRERAPQAPAGAAPAAPFGRRPVRHPRGWVAPVRRVGARGGRWERPVQAASTGPPRDRVPRTAGRPARWVARDAAAGSPHRPDRATEQAGPTVRRRVAHWTRPALLGRVVPGAWLVALAGPGAFGHAFAIPSTGRASGRRRVQAWRAPRTEPAPAQRWAGWWPVQRPLATGLAPTVWQRVRWPAAGPHPAVWRLARGPRASALPGPAVRWPMGPGSGPATSEVRTRPAPPGRAPGLAPDEVWRGASAASRAANELPPVRGGTGLPGLARPVVRWKVARLPRVETRVVRMPGPRPTGRRWASSVGPRPRACGPRYGRRAGGGATAARDRRRLPGTPPLPAGPERDPLSGTAPATGRACQGPRQRRHARELDPPPASPVGRRLHSRQRLRRRPLRQHPQPRRLRPAASWSRSIAGLDPGPGPRAVVRPARSVAPRPLARRRPRHRRSAPQGPVPRSSEPDGGAGSCGGLRARTHLARPGGTAQGRVRRPPGVGALHLRGPGRWNQSRAWRQRHRRGYRCLRGRWAPRPGWRSQDRSAGPATSRSRDPPSAGEPVREPGAPRGHRQPGRAAERPAPATRRPPDGQTWSPARPAGPRDPPRLPSPATPRSPDAPPPPARRPWRASRDRW
jgi:hypothetical protein